MKFIMDWQNPKKCQKMLQNFYRFLCIEYHWCQKVGVKKELKNSDDKLNINVVEGNPMTT